VEVHNSLEELQLPSQLQVDPNKTLFTSATWAMKWKSNSLWTTSKSRTSSQLEPDSFMTMKAIPKELDL
jgi:hypothetical protein